MVEVLRFLPRCPCCGSSSSVVPVFPNRGSRGEVRSSYGWYYRCPSGRPGHPAGSLGETRPVEFRTGFPGWWVAG